MFGFIRKVWDEFRSGKISLGWKFALFVSLILAVTMGIATFINYESRSRQNRANLKFRGRTLGSFIASVSPPAIYSSDIVTLNEYVREAVRREDVIYAMITDQKNRPLTNVLNQDDPCISSAIETLYGDASNFQASPEATLGILRQVNKRHDVIIMNFPIEIERTKLGFVIVGLSPKRTDHLNRIDMIRQLGMNISIIAILMLGIYLIFRFSALRRIRQLYRGAISVAEGDLNLRIRVSGRDELGLLTEAFNTMVDRLQTSIREKDEAMSGLKELNRSLESHVLERTRDLEELNTELEYSALHDALTGLPNRSLIRDRIEQAIRSAHRSDSSFAVFMMDLDRFKEINDALGHHVGDQILKETADRLIAVLRETDTVGRLGGDEFALVTPDTDRGQAKEIADKLLQIFDSPFSEEGLNINAGASLGIAMYPESGKDVQNLLIAADVAMYAAKTKKRGYFIYDSLKDNTSTLRLTLIGDMHTALDEDSLLYYFQPIYGLEDGLIRGMEVLTRWPHPKLGFVPPDDFISVIEQTALILPFTIRVTEASVKQWIEWKRMGWNIPIYINISMRNLQDPDFTDRIEGVLENFEISHIPLVMEITESVVMADPDKVLEVMARLNSLGITFAIDDFGTGYSSLSKLKHLPASAVKIDHSFVVNMDSDRDNAAIVKSTIDLSHNLGLGVIAEGVESEAVHEMLKDLGCDMSQGYYYQVPDLSKNLLGTIEAAGVAPAKVDDSIV